MKKLTEHELNILLKCALADLEGLTHFYRVEQTNPAYVTIKELKQEIEYRSKL